MPVLRYVHLVALVVWLGGTVVAGAIVAPTAFAVLQAWDPVQGRVLAGEVFGAVLARLHVLGYAAGGAMIASLTAQRLIGPRPAAYGLRVALVSAMLAAFVWSGAGVLPRVEALRREVSGPIDALPPDDARRMAFDRLHTRSTRLVGAAAVGGLLLLAWEVRERT